MEESVVLSAVRIPTGKFLGSLAGFAATELGAMVIREAVARADVDPDEVDEAIMGNVVSAGLGQAPARQAALGAGLPPKVAALTINKVCGSGLKAVMLAAQGIATGESQIVVAGGMESMSNCPYMLPNARHRLPARTRTGRRLDGSRRAVGCLRRLPHGLHGRGRRREVRDLAGRADEYALGSHKKALAAQEAGRFSKEILPVDVPLRKADPIRFEKDESPRADTSLEALAKLKPAFKKDGTVTAGNAPGVNDGAAALVVTSAAKAKDLGRKPIARVVAQAVAGVEPSLVMMAPVDAVRKLWKKTGWSADDVDLVELNEAFAVQAIAVIRELDLDPDKVNVNGSAVALGHPIGASGHAC